MDYFGYAGRIMNIDLSAERVWESKLTDELINDYVGGLGVNTKIFSELYKPGTDPFDPENPLVIGCGPFVGTFIPSTPKAFGMTRFPLTMSIGFSSVGMNLGKHLKYAGYDGLNITKSSDNPVYVKIFNDTVEVHDAAFLWGKDIHETTDWFWDNFGTDWSVLTIGPAGENLVRIATALVDKAATLGKGGLGAVMGSKKLKAVIVKGTRGLTVSEPKKLRTLVDTLVQEIKTDPFTYELAKYGQMVQWDVRSLHFMHRNSAELFPLEKAGELFGREVYMKVRKGRLACPSCPLGEKELLKIREGDFQGTVTYISNWPGRTKDFGIRLDLSNYNQNVKCMELVNRYGLCSHNTSSIIELAIDLYQKGIICKKDTGVELNWDFETTKRLIDQVAFRKGFGEVLAEGFFGLIKKYGEEAQKQAVIIKGMDPQMDPRPGCLGPLQFAQIVDPRGGRFQAAAPIEKISRHILRSELDPIKRFCEEIGVPEDEMGNIFKGTSYSVARLTRHTEDWYVILSSLGICTEPQIQKYYSLERVAQLYQYVVGINRSPGELKKAAERAWNLLKILNVVEGFARKDDKIPWKWLEPIDQDMKLRDPQQRPMTGEDVEDLLDDYYRARGWDVETGIPNEQVCKELGFDEGLIRKLGKVKVQSKKS